MMLHFKLLKKRIGFMDSTGGAGSRIRTVEGMKTKDIHPGENLRLKYYGKNTNP